MGHTAQIRTLAEFQDFIVTPGSIPRKFQGLRGDFGVKWWDDFLASLVFPTGDIPTQIVLAGGGITSVPVTSVFGRVGAVVAALNDYNASQINNDSTVVGATVADALDTLAGTVGVTTFLALTDTPGAFVANQPVVNNPAGTALEFNTGWNIITTDIFGTGGVGRAASIRNVEATATQPTLIPRRDALTAGIGANAAGSVSLITSSLERFRADVVGVLTQFGPRFEGSVAGSATILNVAASGTVPNICPNRADQNTGIGQDVAGRVLLITDNVAQLRVDGDSTAGQTRMMVFDNDNAQLERCASDHIDHVRTQIPYALAVGGAAVFLGCLPVGFGISPWIGLGAGAAGLLALLLVIGKRRTDI